MWCRGLVVVLCAVRIVSPDVSQVFNSTDVPVFPRSLEDATLRKPEDDAVTEGIPGEARSSATSTSTTASALKEEGKELLLDQVYNIESSSPSLQRNEDVTSPVLEYFREGDKFERSSSTVTPSLSVTQEPIPAEGAKSSSSSGDVLDVDTASESVTISSDDHNQKFSETASSRGTPSSVTRDQKTLDLSSSTTSSSVEETAPVRAHAVLGSFPVTDSKEPATPEQAEGSAPHPSGQSPEAHGLVSSSPAPESAGGLQSDSEDTDEDYYDEDEEYEDEEADEVAGEEVVGEEEEEEDDEDDEDEEEDAELLRGPEHRAEVRSLSDLPLSKLLQVRGELRRLAGLAGLGVSGLGQEDRSRNGGAGASWRSSSSNPMAETHPEAMALNWSGSRTGGKGSDDGASKKGGPLRRGAWSWGWDEEEEEEDEHWSGGWKSKKKKGKDIGSVFQIAVTFLAFLAFGGYLLCLCITAIKGGGGYYYPTYGQLRPAPNVMMVMMAPNRLAPNRRPRPPAATGKKRRRRSESSGEAGAGGADHAWWSWTHVPWDGDDEHWDKDESGPYGPWAAPAPALGNLRTDHLHSALLLLAEGYATYYHRKYNT